MPKSQLQKLKKTGVKFQREIQEKTIGYILAALGLVAGLAWNEAIKALLESIFPASNDTVIAKFIYAIFLTGLIIMLSSWLMRWLKKLNSSQ